MVYVTGSAVLLLWVVPIAYSYDIMTRKGRSRGAGFALGLYLSWLGVLIAKLLPPSRPTDGY
jgi:hypothetical protein